MGLWSTQSLSLLDTYDTTNVYLFCCYEFKDLLLWFSRYILFFNLVIINVPRSVKVKLGFTLKRVQDCLPFPFIFESLELYKVQQKEW